MLAASIYKVCDMFTYMAVLEGQVVSGFSESTSFIWRLRQMGWMHNQHALCRFFQLFFPANEFFQRSSFATHSYMYMLHGA